MSERWGDSQRDRDALDAWITREDHMDARFMQQEVVARCWICHEEIEEGVRHPHLIIGEDPAMGFGGPQIVVEIDVSSGTMTMKDLPDILSGDNTPNYERLRGNDNRRTTTRASHE